MNAHRRPVPARVVIRQELRRSGAAGVHRTRVPRSTARRAAIREQLA